MDEHKKEEVRGLAEMYAEKSPVERVRRALMMNDAGYGTMPSLEDIGSLLREADTLRNFRDFVNLWCNRETKISDGERLSAIKHHPTARAGLKAHG